MKSFFEPEARNELLTRLEKLNARSGSQWGKMNPAQMLSHCTASIQVPLGELKVKKTALVLIGWAIKKSYLGDKPFRKGLPTASEYLRCDEHDFDAEKSLFLETFNKLAQGPGVVVCHTHAVFGAMTDQEWGRLMYKHLDHHFHQFGV